MRRSHSAFSDTQALLARGRLFRPSAHRLASRQPNFSRLVLDERDLEPSFLNLKASTLISGSLREKYSLRLPGGLRISTELDPVSMREGDGFFRGQADLVGNGADARFVHAASRPQRGRATQLRRPAVHAWSWNDCTPIAVSPGSPTPGTARDISIRHPFESEEIQFAVLQ